jgi:hypothetical protein
VFAQTAQFQNAAAGLLSIATAFLSACFKPVPHNKISDKMQHFFLKVQRQSFHLIRDYFHRIHNKYLGLLSSFVSFIA